MRLTRFTPSMAVALAALFFALGGSAFALRSTTAARCPVGSARAIAYVTGDINGIPNLPVSWSSSASLFHYRYSCSGGTIEVRKAIEEGGGFDVRFNGNPGRYPVATPVYSDAYGLSSAPMPDGSFHISEAGGALSGSFSVRSNASVIIVLF